jgi:hypothetical protein
MVKWKSTKGQTMFSKILHMKLKIEQHEPQHSRVNPSAPKGY